MVNRDPYGEGWLLKLKLANPAELDNLLSAEEYDALLATAEAHTSTENTHLPSPYIPNTDADRRAMLRRIGVASVGELFADIPSQHREPALTLPPPLSELELRRELAEMAARNRPAGEMPCFLGAGAYRHFIPSVVDHVIRRGEFATAYTPYQPEISQGTLQTIFEFQSLVCELTGMDVATPACTTARAPSPRRA